jgi:hypothetical protein
MFEVIPKNKVYRFKIKLSLITNNTITIGIIDRLKGKTNQYCWSNNYDYALLYAGFSGQVRP